MITRIRQYLSSICLRLCNWLSPADESGHIYRYITIDRVSDTDDVWDDDWIITSDYEDDDYGDW